MQHGAMGGTEAAVSDATALVTAMGWKRSGRPSRRRGGAPRGGSLLKVMAIGLMVVTRGIGEASNPGPALRDGGFDDPEGGMDARSFDDDECDNWGPPPPLVDDGPWDEELADTLGRTPDDVQPGTGDGADHGGVTDADVVGHSTPDFVNAHKFLGKREGMKFGKGGRGLGVL